MYPLYLHITADGWECTYISLSQNTLSPRRLAAPTAKIVAMPYSAYSVDIITSVSAAFTSGTFVYPERFRYS